MNYDSKSRIQMQISPKHALGFVYYCHKLLKCFCYCVQIKKTLDENDWVRTDEAHFGKVGSSYDFTKYGGDGDNFEQMLQTLPTTIEQAKAEKQDLERKVNFKAM